MGLVFALMASKSLLSFARVMITMTAGFLQNALTVVVNLKTSWMVVCVAKTPTDIYLDFLPWFRAMSLRLSLKVCATFMNADCCSENVV